MRGNTYKWHFVRFTNLNLKGQSKESLKIANEEDLHNLHFPLNNIFHLYCLTCQYGQGFPFPGFLSLNFRGLVRVLTRWIGLSHVFYKPAQRRRGFTAMPCVQQPSCGRHKYTSWENSVHAIGVKYRDRCSEGIMGGQLERVPADDELTMQHQRPGSREYLWTHLQLQGGYRIMLQEIRCKSV